MTTPSHSNADYGEARPAVGRQMRDLCIFADQDTDRGRLSAYLAGTGSDSVLLVTLEDAASLRGLAGERGGVKSLDTYGPTEPVARKKTMQLVRDWAGQPLGDGGSLKERLTWQGVSMWWFLDSRWLQVGEKYFRNLHLSIRRLEQIARILSDESPRQAISLVKDEEFNIVLQLVAQRLQVPLEKKFVSTRVGKNLWCRLLSFLAVCRFPVRAFLFLLQQIRYGVHLKRRRWDSRPVLFLMGDHWGNVWDPNRGCYIEGETYTYRVFQAVKQHFPILFAVELTARQLTIRFSKSKFRDPRILYTPLEAYTDWKVLLRSFRHYRAMRRRWKELLRSGALETLFIFEDIPCLDLILPRLRLFFTFGLLETLLTLETAFALVQKQNPVAVVLDSRMSRAGRAVIHAARRHGIRSVALEHSFFIRHNIGDYLTAGDRAGGNQNPAVACPLPDRILVYGEQDKEQMVAGWFPPEIIEVTGAPRWDAVPFLVHAWDKKPICQRYGLDPAHPIVMLTMQEYFSRDAEDAVIREVCTAVRELGDTQLVIKLHPLQRLSSKISRRFSRIAANVGLSRVVLEGGYKLYELLAVSDILVTLNCNTAIEASLMDKPVIILDLFQLDHADSFSNHPALVVARSGSELASYLRAALNDDATRRRSQWERQRFVSSYCFRKDGLAWQRVTQAILQEVHRGQKERPWSE